MPSAGAPEFEIRGIGQGENSFPDAEAPKSGQVQPVKLRLSYSRRSAPAGPVPSAQFPTASRTNALSWEQKTAFAVAANRSADSLPTFASSAMERPPMPSLPHVSRLRSKLPEEHVVAGHSLMQDGKYSNLSSTLIPERKESREPEEEIRAPAAVGVSKSPDPASFRPVSSLSLRERAYLKTSSGHNTPAASERAFPSNRRPGLPTPGYLAGGRRVPISSTPDSALEHGSQKSEGWNKSSRVDALPARPASVVGLLRPGTDLSRPGTDMSRPEIFMMEDGWEDKRAAVLKATDDTLSEAPTTQLVRAINSSLSGRALTTGYLQSRSEDLAPLRLNTADLIRQNENLRRENEELRRIAGLSTAGDGKEGEARSDADQHSMPSTPLLRVPPASAKTPAATLAPSTARNSIGSSSSMRFIDGPEPPRKDRIASLMAEIEAHRKREDGIRYDLVHAMADDEDEVASRFSHLPSTVPPTPVMLEQLPIPSTPDLVRRLNSDASSEATQPWTPPQAQQRASPSPQYPQSAPRSALSTPGQQSARRAPGPRGPHAVTVGKWEAVNQTINEQSLVTRSPSSRLSYSHPRFLTAAIGGGGSYAYAALGRGPIFLEERLRLPLGHMTKQDDLQATQAMAAQRRATQKRGLAHTNSWHPHGLASNFQWAAATQEEPDLDPDAAGQATVRKKWTWGNAGASAYRSYIQSAQLRPAREGFPNKVIPPSIMDETKQLAHTAAEQPPPTASQSKPQTALRSPGAVPLHSQGPLAVVHEEPSEGQFAHTPQPSIQASVSRAPVPPIALDAVGKYYAE